jgi:hypothetical protein
MDRQEAALVVMRIEQRELLVSQAANRGTTSTVSSMSSVMASGGRW